MKKAIYFSLLILQLLFHVEAVIGQQLLEPAVTVDDIDITQCVSFGDSRIQNQASIDTIKTILGVNQSTPETWSTPLLAGEVRYFRIAFNKPIQIGTICSSFSDQDHQIAFLKPTSGYPGLLNDDSDWQQLSDGKTKTLPVGTRIRALRFTINSHQKPWATGLRKSTMASIILLKKRYWDPAELGRSCWVQKTANTAEKGSKTYHQWLGHWPTALSLDGLAILSVSRIPTINVLPATNNNHPDTVKDESWNQVAINRQSIPFLYSFKEPIVTSAVKITFPQNEVNSKNKPLIFSLSALSENQAPPQAFIKPIPFKFTYQMPLDGFLAIRIWDENGKEVRRLISEVERTKGHIDEGWNLKNDFNFFVKPGKYYWSGIARPPLKLTYEMTVYSAGSPPWQAPVPGGGGWMADHSPPASICAVDNKIIMGSGGAEFGLDTIATDLDGNKLWGTDHLPSLRLASDESHAYVVQNSKVIQIDPAKGFKCTPIFKFHYTENVPGHSRSYIANDTSGTTCANGQLFISYQAPEAAWIKSSLNSGDIDYRHCFPPPVNKKVHETAYNQTQQLLSAFQILRCTDQSQFGDATTSGDLANTLVLALKKEMPVGSVVIPDCRINVYALKPGKELPKMFKHESSLSNSNGLADEMDEELGFGDLGELGGRFDPDRWEKLRTSTSSKQTGIAVAPKGGIRTKYLAFYHPDLQRIDYAMVLNRRFQDISQKATLFVLEGQKNAQNSWTTTRSKTKHPLSEQEPATAALVWEKEEAVRGFMITKPMSRIGAKVDVWVGKSGATIGPEDIKRNENWKTMYYHKPGNGLVLKWHTDTTITGDFGTTVKTRALRFRVTDPPSDPCLQYERQGAISGGFEHFIAFQPIGHDLPLTESLAKRISIIDLKSDKQPLPIRHLSAPAPTVMVGDSGGNLYVAVDKGIAKATGISNQQHILDYKILIPRNQVKKPRGMAFDNKGNLYIADGFDKCIKVFNKNTGELIRTIGSKRLLGKWDPTTFSEISDICIDKNNKLWVVERVFQPKRICRFDALTGTFEKEFLGPTHYGGGGFMDPGDHTVVNHLGMKFRIDYQQKTWKLEAVMHPYGSDMYMPDRVVYHNDKRYLVGDGEVVTPFGDKGPISGIFIEENFRARPVALAGTLGVWKAMKENDELKKSFGHLEGNNTSFIWSDINDDHQIQAKEVQVIDSPILRFCAGIGNDLSFNFKSSDAGYRLTPQTIHPNGAPEYDISQLQTVPGLTNNCISTENGNCFVMQHKMLNNLGQVKWTYPDHYMGIQNSYKLPTGFTNRDPGQLAGSFSLLGHFSIAGENLFCVGGNNGDYYAFTDDGLLVATIIGGPRGYGKRFFSIPEAIPGQTDLSDLRKTIEDFHGSVCKAEDGNVYAIAGKNHISIIRVDGLEKMKRLHGEFNVTQQDLIKTRIWEEEKARIQKTITSAKHYPVKYVQTPPVIDGDIFSDWHDSTWIIIKELKDDHGNIVESGKAKISYDNDYLYLAATAIDHSPMLNSAKNQTMVFQHGDGLDLNLGLDQNADPKRSDAEYGDIRLIIAPFNQTNKIVLYRYKSINKKQPVSFKSAMGEILIDEINPIQYGKVVINKSDKQWTLEAAIPWKKLGFSIPEKAFTLQGDIGLLESDQEGITTVSRCYWANRSNVIMSDLPSEAKVIPALWGQFNFLKPDVSNIINNHNNSLLD